MRAPALLSGLVAALFLVLPVHAQHELPGSALTFDGFNDLVRVPHHPDLDLTEAFTLEAWVRSDGSPGGVAGMWGIGGEPGKFLIFIGNGRFWGRLSRPIEPFGFVDVEGPEVVEDAWVHVALTFDGHTLVFYRAGVEYSREEYEGPLTSAPRDLWMGTYPHLGGAPDMHPEMLLDEVRLWSVARTPEELQRTYTQVVAGDEPDLVAAYHMDGTAPSQTVLDATAGGHHGTLGQDGTADPDDPQRLDSEAPMRWRPMGHALAGSLGAPRLTGAGTVFEGFPVSLALDGALPGAPTAFVIGHAAAPTAFKGGTMVPALDQVVPGLVTDGLGHLELATIWPALPPSTDLFVQFWIEDGAGPAGYAASNALWVESP